MSVFESRFIAAISLLIVSVISGAILSALGRPLNTPVFAVHKLVGVAALVLAVLVITAMNSSPELGAPPIGMILLTGVLFLLLIASGGLLSLGMNTNLILLTLHKILPILLLVSFVWMVYLQLL